MRNHDTLVKDWRGLPAWKRAAIAAARRQNAAQAKAARVAVGGFNDATTGAHAPLRRA